MSPDSNCEGQTVDGAIGYALTAPGGSGGWSQCASENGTCSFTGTMTVAYGASGHYYYQSLTGGTACSNSVFGDPIVGTAKACYTSALPTGGVWTNQCAQENGTCSFSGTMVVAYGANGQYYYGTYTNGTACSNSVFGDPIYGTAKACYNANQPS